MIFSLYKEEELALHSEVADGVEGLSARYMRKIETLKIQRSFDLQII